MPSRSVKSPSIAKPLIGGFVLGLAVMFFIAEIYLAAYPPAINNTGIWQGQGWNNVSHINGGQPFWNASTTFRQATAHVTAVSTDGTGILGNTTVEVVPGRGRVLLSTNPFVEPDTQESLATAARVAAAFTGYSMSDIDIIASFDLGPDQNISLIGGPSAGISITLATIAALQGRQVRSDVAMTGTIENDGSIGPIGGVLEKAEAAAKAGMKIFLIPSDQGLVNYYERQVEKEQIGQYTIQRITYVPRTVTLDNYTMQWGMRTYEVGNISEAATLALSGVITVNVTVNATDGAA